MPTIFKTESTSTTYSQEIFDGIDAKVAYGKSDVVLLADNKVDFENLTDEEKINILSASPGEGVLLDIPEGDKESNLEFTTLLESINRQKRVELSNNNPVIVGRSNNTTQEQAEQHIAEALKVRSALAYKSKPSEQVVFNTLQEPKVRSNFVYNYFQANEKNIQEQEDLENEFYKRKDEILSSKQADKSVLLQDEPPKYIELTWDFLESPKQLNLDESFMKSEDKRTKQILYKNSGIKRFGDKLARKVLNKRLQEFLNPSYMLRYTNNSKSFRNNHLINIDVSDSIHNRSGNIATNGGVVSNKSNPNNLLKLQATSSGFYEIYGNPTTTVTSGELELIPLARALRNIDIPVEEPDSILSDPELVGIDYVGYIIEKERLIKNTGQWKRVANYYILGVLNNNFRDTAIAYGEVYRYRVSSVAKATIPVRNNITADLNLLSLSEIEKNGLTDAIIKKIKNITSVDVSYLKPGHNNQQTSSELVNGYSIEETSDGRRISARQDIGESLSTVNGILKHKFTTKEVVELYNKTIIKYRKNDNYQYRSFYFESDPCRVWQYIGVYENEPPPPPRDIKIVPNSKEKKIRIIWNPPPSNQQDIAEIRLYRRIEGATDITRFFKQIDVEFLVRQDITKTDYFKEMVAFGRSDEVSRLTRESNSGQLFQQDYNYFDDEDVELGKTYIYALESVDVHGIKSFLSVQIGAQLNDRFHIERMEKPLKFISGSGLRLDEIDKKAKVFKSYTDVYFARNKIKIKPSLAFSDTSKSFIVKIRSLDTFETKEVKVTINNKERKAEEFPIK